MNTIKAEVGDYIELWEIISKEETTISWSNRCDEVGWHRAKFPIVKCTDREIIISLDNTPHAKSSWTHKDKEGRKVYSLGAEWGTLIKKFKCKYCEKL